MLNKKFEGESLGSNNEKQIPKKGLYTKKEGLKSPSYLFSISSNYFLPIKIFLVNVCFPAVKLMIYMPLALTSIG